MPTWWQPEYPARVVGIVPVQQPGAFAGPVVPPVPPVPPSPIPPFPPLPIPGGTGGTGGGGGGDYFVILPGCGYEDDDPRWCGAIDPKRATWTAPRVFAAPTPIVVVRKDKLDLWPIIVLGIAAAVAIWCLAEETGRPKKKPRRRRR